MDDEENVNEEVSNNDSSPAGISQPQALSEPLAQGEEESNEDNSLPGTSHSQALPEPSIQDKEVLIVFDKAEIKQLHGSTLTILSELNKSLKRINPYRNTAKEWINTYSAIAVGKEIYVFCWDRDIYFIKPFDKKSSWGWKTQSIQNHGKEPAAAFLESHVQTSECTTSTQVRRKIYLCGGGWERSFESRKLPRLTDTCEKYDLDSDKWENIASMQEKKRSHSVIEMKGYIYSIGGVGEKQVSDGKSEPEVVKCENDQKLQVKQEDIEDREEDTEKPLSSVERYDPEENTWLVVASMKEPRVAPAVTKYNGEIYVLGGSKDNVYLVSVESYDPGNNLWTILKCSPMTTGRILFRACVLDGKLFAVGSNGKKAGREKANSIESVKLDALINKPEEAKWEKEGDWLKDTDCNFMATVKMALP